MDLNNKNVENVWNDCLSFIGDNISKQAYDTWFAPIVALKLKGNVLTIQVPSKFFYEWIEENYLNLIKSALKKNLGENARLIYSVVMEKNYDTKTPYTVSIPSSNKKTVKNTQDNAAVSSNAPFKNPFVIPGLQKIKVESQLNPNSSFENFIEGESNRLGRSAGNAISKNPGGTSFNPLFIYGGVGLGKTHLINAIGIKTKDLFPEKTVLYVTAEQFTQQYIDSVKSNNRNDFIHFYQMLDVLLMDDVQFLGGKKSTQEVFFHVFNHLHQNGKQLILTSDKPPVEMQDFEQRLLSRFKWGLNAEIQIPDFEMRRKILENKLYRDGIEIPTDVIDFIAQNIKTNVRELEGTLISIIAQSSFNNKEINLNLAKQTLDKFIKNTKKEISIDSIQKVVCDYFEINKDVLVSKTRKREIVQARQLAMFFAKKMTKNSLANIGRELGNRDHATVLHACKTVKDLSETDRAFKNYIEDIERKLNVSI